MNFFRTLSIFRRNPFVNPYLAGLRHVGWQVRKGLNAFPCVLSVDGFQVEIRDRAIANGCGALLNGMGYYDANNMYFLKEVFQRNLFQTFLDIGSNIGIYALIVGKHSSAQVHAFEPHPYTFSLLQANVARNRLTTVHCHQLALSSHVGSVRFDDQPGSTVNQVILDKDTMRKSILVDVITGDEFCHRTGITPEVLKIDVEGHEEAVLNGFQKYLCQAQLVFVEIKSSQQAVASLMQAAGLLGPFKVDYRARQLSTTFDSYEDPVFIHPTALKLLGQFGFQIANNEQINEL